MTSEQVASTGSTEAHANARFAIDARRWTRYELMTIGLSLTLLIFMVRPWYDIAIDNCPPPGFGPCQNTQFASADGTAAHRFLWLTVVLFLIILGLLILRAGFGRVSFLIWPSEQQVIAGAACVNFVIVLVAFFMKTGFVSETSAHLSGQGLPPLSITWESAAWVALALAAGAAAVAVLNLPKPRQVSPLGPAVFHWHRLRTRVRP